MFERKIQSKSTLRMLTWLSVAILALVLGLSACAPAPQNEFAVQGPNHTGFRAADGKLHTGAGPDADLATIKAEVAGTPDTTAPLPNSATAPPAPTISSVATADQKLAAKVIGARLDSLPGEGSPIRIRFALHGRDLLSFDFNNSMITTAKPEQPGDIHYKTALANGPTGSTSPFELDFVCRQGGGKKTDACPHAILTLRDKDGSGATTKLIIRNQDVIVLAKAPAQVNETAKAKHETLKRLEKTYGVAQPAVLQTFEVAWGPSGFALNMRDPQLCPAGRLVETNDLDEPLKLNCAGVTDVRDLEGRMIGNTTRGEILLEIASVSPGVAFEDSTDMIFLVVSRKKVASKSTTATPGATTTPPKSDPATTEAPTADDDDDEPIFLADVVKQTSPEPISKGLNWLFNQDFNHPVTKMWARDRKHAAIEAGVKKWSKSPRLKNFARHYLPNRQMVSKKLALNNVPPEFAIITMMESNFFVSDGYPIETPGGSSALGPWQFLEATGKNNGLRVFPKMKINGKWGANPCDERADLAKSSEAAGRYLRSILNMFPQDPKLAILGYNQGEFGVERQINGMKSEVSQSRLKVISELGLSFWAVRKFNMFDRKKRGGLEYVENFVSIYHAALEVEPIAMTGTYNPWKPAKNSCN